jgi:hypothetical protein
VSFSYFFYSASGLCFDIDLLKLISVWIILKKNWFIFIGSKDPFSVTEVYCLREFGI